MKTMIKSAIIVIACFCVSNGMAQSVMFMNQTLDPLPGHAVALENGVKAHNTKFHAKGDATARLFAILTGPRSGQYAWVQGPMTYATLDKPLSAEHTMDWDKNVGAHCNSTGELRIMKRDEERSYNPSNEVTADNYLARVFYGVTNPGQTLEAIGMIKKLYEANKIATARRVYTSEFRTADGEAITLVYPFKSFTEFEKNKGLPFADLEKEMDKVHGAGAMKKFQELMQSSNAGWYDEVRTLVK